MIYRSPKQKIDEYFANPSISQSQLKLFMKGFDYYQQQKDKLPDKYYDEPKDHFIIGSAVDMLLTRELQDFQDEYYITTLTQKPSDTQISIMRYVFDKAVEALNGEPATPLNIANFLDYDVQEAFEFHRYQSNWGLEAKKNAFRNETSTAYWNEMLASGKRQILTFEDKVLIDRIVRNFRSSSSTEMIFSAGESSDVDVFFQVPVYCKLDDNLYIKGLLDVVMVNHRRNTIKIYDFKTMNDSTINFPYDYKRRGYDTQGAFYWYASVTRESLYTALEQMMGSASYERRSHLRRCILNEFGFAVVSKMFPDTPATMYVLYEKDIADILKGRPLAYSHSVGVDGELHEHKHKPISSLLDNIYNLKNSIGIGSDIRCSGTQALTNFI